MNTQRFINFRWIFYPFLACLFGIVVAGYLYSNSIETLIISLLLLSSLAFLLIWKKKYKIMLVLFACFFIGCGLFFIGYFTTKPTYYQGNVSVVGRVSDNFEETKYSYIAVIDEVKINGKSDKNVKVYISKGENDIKIGDTIAFESSLESVHLFTLDSFNSSNYRAGVGYTAEVSSDDIVVSNNNIKIDEKIRLAIKEKLYSNMSEESASISYAVLFGDKSGIVYEVEEAYRDSGIIHILAVSGLHISFLILLIFGFLKLLHINKYIRFLITTLIIIFYAFLCGFTPSVIRASVMGIIMMISSLLGRRYDSLNSLGFAGLVIILFSPLSAFDVGFLMSISCVCGIILLYPAFYRFFIKWCPDFVSKYFAVSFSAQVAIFPFLALFSSQFNLLFFVINLLVVSIFSILYPFLFIISMLSLILPFLSSLFIVGDYGIRFITILAQIFSTSSLKVALTPLSFGICCFFFILVFILSQVFMAKPINKFILSCFLILCLCCNYGFTSISTKFSTGVVYLNSYDEQVVILKNSSGQVLLIGKNYILTRYMNNNKVNSFDYYLAFEELSMGRLGELSDYNISHYIAREGDTSVDNILISYGDYTISAGDFVINYILNDDEDVLGACINFDQICVFVANDEENNYNNLTYYKNAISEYNPHLVIAGNNQDIGRFCDATVVTSKDYAYSDFSYDLNGNLYFKLDYDSFVVRGLD